jgi:DNA polymerase elongation subunit (family B)
MRERDPAPQINDRVQYAFVVTDNPKALQAVVEDPKFIQRTLLDYAFYIKSQITEPVNSSLSWSTNPGARTWH